MYEEEIVPQAYFDVLAIANDAPRSAVPLSVVEMHLFSYLACVLSLFKGTAVAQWGYDYAVTSEGFPFSGSLESARKNVLLAGYLDMVGDELLEPVQPVLAAELEIVQSMALWSLDRRSALRTATECTLALPTGSIRFAINRTAGVESPVRLGQKRRLLEKDDIDLLYDEYRVITEVLGTDAGDTLSPAVLWLSAKILRNEDDDSAV